jgi:hypothetical protein
LSIPRLLLEAIKEADVEDEVRGCDAAVLYGNSSDAILVLTFSGCDECDGGLLQGRKKMSTVELKRQI